MKLTWDNIYTDTNTLYKKIIVKFAPDIILGISTGGLIPSVILNKLFQSKLITHGVQSYNSNLKASTSYIYQNGISICNDYRDKNILVVDDLSDTGDTFSNISYELLTGKNNIKYASLYYKPHTKFIPEFSVLEIPNNIWITFPWEI